METSPADIRHPALATAAAVLREFGWCQGSLREGTRFCALGALSKAWRGTAHLDPDHYTARDLCRTAEQRRTIYHLAEQLGYEEKGDPTNEELKRALWTIIRWNDAEDQTGQDVIEALERAAYEA